MEQLEIFASIRKEKLPEFNQSKLTFLEGLRKIDGYDGYAENPGADYHLCINWNNRSKLESFLSSELYCFFHGAIMTLGSVKKVQINSVV